MIFQRSSKDLISVSNCHSKFFASSSFYWFQWGLYQVLKQPLRTIFPHVAGIYLPYLQTGSAWLQKHHVNKAQRHCAKCKRDENFSLPKGWGASVLLERSCFPPSLSKELSVWTTDWGNSLGSRTRVLLVHMFSYMWHKLQARKYISYHTLRNYNCTYENSEEGKCPGSPNSKWTLMFLCIKLVILPSLNLLMMNSSWSSGLRKVPIWFSTSSVMELRIWKRA